VVSWEEYVADDFYFVAAEMITTKTIAISSFQFDRAYELIEYMLKIFCPVFYTYKLISPFVLIFISATPRPSLRADNELKVFIEIM
jgi:hypothetical protein